MCNAVHAGPTLLHCELALFHLFKAIIRGHIHDMAHYK